MLKKSQIALAALLCCILTGVVIVDIREFARESVPEPAPQFTPTQEIRIGEIAAAYIIGHPEVLAQINEALQAQHEARGASYPATAACKLQHRNYPEAP